MAVLTGILLLSAACAPRRPAMAERPTSAIPQPDVGIVHWVEPGRISVLLLGGSRPRRYLRTQETEVICEGAELEWSALSAGQAIRIQSVKGPFGPLRATEVEILTGEQEAEVRRQMLAQEASRERSGTPPNPRLRNLHVSVGRGS